MNDVRKILIVVPHPSRDLEGHALVGFHLSAKYGHEPAFCDVDSLEDRLFEFEPDAVLLDFLGWDSRTEQAKLAKRLGINVAVLPIAGLYESREEIVREAGKLTGASQFVDLYFTWGPYARESIIQDRLIAEERVHVIGCPRFDLYSSQFIGLLGSRSELLRSLRISRDNAPLILWTTNTPHFARHQPQQLRQRAIHSKWSEQEIQNDIDDERTQFQQHSQIIAALAARHPEWNFVIKVHPMESTLPYQPLVRRARNVRLVADTPIRSLLYHSDVVLQRGCTTATEAWMFGKPVLHLGMGIYHREWAHQAYRRGNQVVRTLDETDEALTRYIAGAPITAEQGKARVAFITEFYFQIDGGASERCSELLHNLVMRRTKSDREFSRAAIRTEAKARQAATQNRLTNRIKRLFGMRESYSLRFWRHANNSRRITEPMVRELFHRYGELLGKDRSIAAASDLSAN